MVINMKNISKLGLSLFFLIFFILHSASVMADTGLIGYWSMDESSGSNIADSSGNGLNASLNQSDASTHVTGKLSHALYFDGSRDAVITSANSLRPESFTLAAYINIPTKINDWQWIGGHGDNFGLVVRANGTIHVYYYNGSRWPGITIDVPDLRDGQWHHIAGSFNASTGKLSAFVDGVLVGSESGDGPIVYDAGNDFHIGSMNGSRNFNGDLDEVKLYNRALNEAEVAALQAPDIPEVQYTLTTSALHGSITPPGGLFNAEASISLTAIPDLGYTFSHWGGDLSGTANPQNIIMSADKAVTATFTAIPTHTLNTMVVGSGTIGLSPTGGVYNEDSVVSITATPSAGYVFSGWSGDATGNTNPLNVTMSANKTITATFVADTGLIGYWSMDESSGSNIADSSGNGLNASLNQSDASTHVTGKLSHALYFDGSRDAVITSANSLRPESFTLAAYINIPTKINDWQWIGGHGDNFGLVVRANGTIHVYYYNGSRWPGITIDVPDLRDGQWHHIAGSFNASTGKLSAFVDGVLVGSESGDGPIVYDAGNDFHIGSMNGSRNFNGDLDEVKLYNRALNEAEVAALQAPDIPEVQYTLTTSALHGSITPPGGLFNAEASISLTAIPDLGYTFSHWGGDLSGTANPQNIIMSADKAVTATFTAIPTHTLNTMVVGSGTIGLSPTGGVYNEDSVVSITATPSAGYVFSGWSGDATGNTNPLNVTMSANKTITATFTAVPTYTLNTAVIGSGSVTSSPRGGTYSKNTVVSITATPSAGYVFSGWSGDATGNTNPLNVTMSTNKNITANFIVYNNLSKLRINEVLAANININMDMDFFAFSDWIELYNDNNQALDIGGYYLSDDKNNPTEWKIPQGTFIDAKGYLLIWADKENTNSNELHTNFKLSQKGETITLADRSGKIIDSLVFSKQKSNLSCAKINNQIVYMSPTPNAQNSIQYNTKDRSKSPEFSFLSGFYDSVISVELLHGSNAVVYYTTDGSIPTQASTLYSRPIQIPKTTTIRAVSFEEGKLPSNIENNTYILNHSTTLPVISLIMDPKYLYDPKTGIYTEGDGTNGIPLDYCASRFTTPVNYAQDWKRPVNFEFFDVNKTSQLSFGADISIAGQCSRLDPKKPFSFELDSKYGTKSLDYQLYQNKKLKKIKDFKLRGGNFGYEIGDTFAALIVEELGLDIDYQSYKTVQMFMNGEYWGIYDIREKKGKGFLKSNYPDIGDIDLIDRSTIKKGDKIAYDALVDYLDNHDLSNNTYYHHVLSLIDEDSFIDYMAFNIYSGNIDWINSNHRCWKERKDGAKWRWMIDDVDYGFKENVNLFEALENAGSYYAMTKLFNGLVKNDTFKVKFKSRFLDLLETKLKPSIIRPLLDRINNERKDYIHLEKTNWLSNYLDNIAEIREFIAVRTNTVKEQLNEFIQ